MKIGALSIFLILSLNIVFGQKSQIMKNQILKSSILKQDVNYNIYLPPNYETTKDYPVIYYLHGFDGNNNSSNKIIKIIDSLILKKDFPETIIIAPNGENSWYIDDYAGKFKYSTMFIEEFIPFVKNKYSITDDINKSTIMGLSMGGFGALRFTMLYPDEFGLCISFMAGINTKEQTYQDSEEDYQKYLHNLYGENLKPSERTNDHFIRNNPLYIPEKIDVETLKSKKWYIQTCDNDYHSLPNAELHIVFHKLKIKHEFRVLNGEHNFDCLSGSMNDALEFIKTNMTTTK